MNRMLRALNPQVALELLCYAVFGILLTYLIASGSYLNYVTPRLKPYLIFTILIMAVWSISGIKRLFQAKHRVRSMHCYVLALPILLLLLPHVALGTSDFTGNYVSGGTFVNQSAGQGGASGTGLSAEHGSGLTDDAAVRALAARHYPLNGLDADNKHITISNTQYGQWVMEIYTNMEAYEGYTVTMTGFVFKDPSLFESNEFVPARLAMACCAADIAPMGLISRYDGAAMLASESWVTVEGQIVLSEFSANGLNIVEAVVNVSSISPAEPVDGYIYPF